MARYDLMVMPCTQRPSLGCTGREKRERERRVNKEEGDRERRPEKERDYERENGRQSPCQRLMGHSILQRHNGFFNR